MSNKKKHLQHVVIVLPTYNERENISRLLDAIHHQGDGLDQVKLSVLVVDDRSPDGTGDVVRQYVKRHSETYLLEGDKQGLGVAYKRGFAYAIEELEADIVFQMDADFSHDPKVIPLLIKKVQEGNDFVIGSRYVQGGSIPQEWPLLRKANSKCGNLFARYLAGLGSVRDCTGGFRAIKADLLEEINFEQLAVKGYAFQISLLYQALKHGAKVAEIPIHFADRTYGNSKLSLHDVTEFVKSCFLIRASSLKSLVRRLFPPLIFVTFCGTLIALLAILAMRHTATFMIWFTIIFSLLMTAQGAFTLFWMLYAWNNPQEIEGNKSPKRFRKPYYSLTSLIPARHEEQVIAHTIRAVSNINYPEDMKEALVICRSDDPGTIEAAEKAIAQIGKNNIKLVVFDNLSINKPHALNEGLKEATKDVVTIFDAEDEPHSDIYHVINTVMLRDKADVVQSGVQLMNFRSSWFATLNVLEYFFWFKSALHLFERLGLTPLGGNTVFFKRKWLKKIGGWDETCLTEDADIGIRLSLAGAKTRVVYDERHCTQEGTPPNLASFIRQRTRWNQGFMQILLKRDWLKLPKLSQKLLAAYILIWPEVQALTFLYIPFALLVMFKFKLPVAVAMVSNLPLYLLLMQIITCIIALYEFTRDYKLRFPIVMPLKILLTIYPFQMVLGLSAFRAVYRSLINNLSWEKTPHTNAHREISLSAPSSIAVPVLAPAFAEAESSVALSFTKGRRRVEAVESKRL
ncbi:glycosyltransferase [Patescibacteria group bacterium]|nr:glycosyltransferase [Patescibacteria group bacterium]